VSPASEDSTPGRRAPQAPQAGDGTRTPNVVDAPLTPREARRAHRLAARQREILSVAEQLFADHGYEGTSLEKIATGVGYSVGAIYNFFPSKDAVYKAVLERNVTALAERLRQSSATSSGGLDKLLTMAVTVIRQVHAYPESALVTLSSLAPERGPSAKKASTGPLLEEYSAAIREGQADGTIRSGNANLLAYYVGGLVFAHLGAESISSKHTQEVSIDDFLEILRHAMEKRPT
jgi:AcrR family transcriptional regulator